jgi:hypothetical protein
MTNQLSLFDLPAPPTGSRYRVVVNPAAGPAPWETDPLPTCACGRWLTPNDVRLGYTQCKECERNETN